MPISSVLLLYCVGIRVMSFPHTQAGYPLQDKSMPTGKSADIDCWSIQSAVAPTDISDPVFAAVRFGRKNAATRQARQVSAIAENVMVKAA